MTRPLPVFLSFPYELSDVHWFIHVYLTWPCWGVGGPNELKVVNVLPLYKVLFNNYRAVSLWKVITFYSKISVDSDSDIQPTWRL